MRRGAFKRDPQAVTLTLVEGLIEECQALTADFKTIGRFYYVPLEAPSAEA